MPRQLGRLSPRSIVQDEQHIDLLLGRTAAGYGRPVLNLGLRDKGPNPMSCTAFCHRSPTSFEPITDVM